MNTPTEYTGIANELSNRVLALIPDNPQILTADFSAFDLFKVPGFKCDDLQPSLAQGGWALADAKRRWKGKEITA